MCTDNFKLLKEHLTSWNPSSTKDNVRCVEKSRTQSVRNVIAIVAGERTSKRWLL